MTWLVSWPSGHNAAPRTAVVTDEAAATQIRDSMRSKGHAAVVWSDDDDAARFVDLAPLFEVAPNGWWRFVPCATCNARRGDVCQSIDSPALSPHIRRLRTGLAIHATLWLFVNHPGDVVGDGRASA